jgi:hypothetical protein
MLNLLQTVALIAAVAVSVYAVLRTERDRRLDLGRARIERVLVAVLGLAQAALRAELHPERDDNLEEFHVAKLRLRAEIQVVGVKGFEAADLMTRQDVPALARQQSEQAVIEIGGRLEELRN